MCIRDSATAAMHSVRPDFSIEQLIYGLPDYAQESFPPYDISYAGGRPLFVTCLLYTS